ncbi:MAG: hypothetical protein WAK17_03210 [Candidatus Nitrosopolaris sp.]
MIASTVLDYAYKHESNANVRERILLIRRITSDGKDDIVDGRLFPKSTLDVTSDVILVLPFFEANILPGKELSNNNSKL